MQPTKQNKRKGRQLLVAAVGIASVSYVGTIQGCAGGDPSEEQNEGALASEDELADIADSEQALTVSNQLVNANQAVTANQQLINKFKWGGLPGSGNLMPGPGGVDIGGGGGGGVIIKVPIPVGNLMVTPIEDQVAIDQATLEALQALEQR